MTRQFKLIAAVTVTATLAVTWIVCVVQLHTTLRPPALPKFVAAGHWVKVEVDTGDPTESVGAASTDSTPATVAEDLIAVPDSVLTELPDNYLEALYVLAQREGIAFPVIKQAHSDLNSPSVVTVR